MSENCESIPPNFLKPKLMSSNRWFCLIYNLKPNYINSTITLTKKKSSKNLTI